MQLLFFHYKAVFTLEDQNAKRSTPLEQAGQLQQNLVGKSSESYLVPSRYSHRVARPERLKGLHLMPASVKVMFRPWAPQR